MTLNLYGYDEDSHENSKFSLGNFNIKLNENRINIFLNSKNIKSIGNFIDLLKKNNPKEVEFYYYSLENRSFKKNFDKKIHKVLREIIQAKKKLSKFNIKVIINKNNPLYDYFFTDKRTPKHSIFNKKYLDYMYILDRHSKMDSLRIDISTKCTLKCPDCFTGQGRKDILPKGFMTFEIFKKIIDKFPEVTNYELSNSGEPFLNPEIDKMIDYAYNQEKNITLLNGTNLNHLPESTLSRIYKIKHIAVSIDGATQATYEKYRIGGNLEKVIENIKKINIIKSQKNSKYPKLYWCFIRFDHCLHEEENAKKMANTLDMKFEPKIAKSNRMKISPNKFTVKDEQYFCQHLWLSPQINWDGELLGCCRNPSISFGNIFEDALNSKKYKEFKKFVIGDKDNYSNLPCRDYCLPKKN